MKKYILIFLLNLIFNQLVKSQNNYGIPTIKIFPPSPTASSLGIFGENPVSYYTGTAQVNIPIHEISTKGLKLPITLNYSASGLKVEERASWVGLKFSLDCGGVITRSVVGYPDDLSGGYMDYFSVINGPTPFNDIYNEMFCSGNGFDTEPDVFYYNINGRSGRLIYTGATGFISNPSTDIKFEPIYYNSTTEITGWKVFTEDGTKYLFGNDNGSTIASEQCISTEFVCKSSWYLTEIKEANGNGKIQIEYNLYNGAKTSSTNYSESLQTLVLFNDPNLGVNNNANGTFSSKPNTSQTSVCYPSKISYEDFEIQFLTSTRTDVVNDQKLDAIKITRNNNLLKQINLHYSYFIEPRLRLDNVDFCDNQNSNCHSYSFDYNPGTIPSIHSNAQDHWGFYNGQNLNLSLIPSDLLPSISNFTHGANRDPSSNVSIISAGLLNKITYPTGGSSEYYYEPHLVVHNPIVSPNEHEYVSLSTNVTFDSDNIPSNPNIIDQKTFTISTAPQIIEINTNYSINHTPITNPQWQLDDPGDYPTCKVRIKDSNGNIIEQSSALARFDGTINLLCTLQYQGTYIFETELNPTNGSWPILTNPNNNLSIYVYSSTEYFVDHQLPGVALTYLGGGSRISKIIDNDLNGNSHIRKFEYLDDNGNLSGRLLSYPIYSYRFSVLEPLTAPWGSAAGACTYKSYHYINLSSRSMGIMGSNNGSHVGYNQVIEYKGDQGEGGKTIYNYTTKNQMGTGAPFAPSRNDDFKGGLLTRKRTYKKNSSGNYLIVHELKNEYNFHQHPNSPNRFVIKGYKTQVRKDGYVCHSGTATQYYTTYYDVISEWYNLKSTTDYTFNENGANPVIQTHNYEYHNSSHMQLTRDIFSNSDGTEITTEIKYPEDYNLLVNSSDPSIVALKMMGEETNSNYKHMTGIPIERIEKKRINGNDFITNGVFTKYNSFGSNNLILPKDVFIFQTNNPLQINSFTPSTLNSAGVDFDSHFKPVLSYDLYDDNGNILQYHKEKNISNSFQWDQNGLYPIASFTNASFTNAQFNNNFVGNECSFSGFENLGNADDHWTGTLTIDNTLSHTGKWSNKIMGGSNQISHNFYPENQKQHYRLSCWVNFPNGYDKQKGHLILNAKSSLFGPALSGSITIPFVGNPNQWTYQEAIIDLENVHQTLNDFNNFWIECIIKNTDPLTFNIDDIRFEPIPCVTQTVTYNEFDNQVSSLSDHNSLPQYFDYDAFNRLKYVRDFNNNVLKKQEYHYKDPINSSDKNKVTEQIFRAPFTISQIDQNAAPWYEFNRSISYLDGLGRLIQTVNEKQNPNALDLITPVQYDQFGRIPKNYLTYSAATNNGSFDVNALSGANNQNSFYQNAPFVAHSQFPYSESLFDNSPLNRVIEQGSPGDVWQIGNNHTVKNKNLSNDADEIFLWSVNLNSGIPVGASSQQFYLQNTLFKKTFINEEGKESYEFTDLIGRIIAKGYKVEVDQSSGETYDFTSGQNITCQNCSTKFVFTYYIYDDLGRLTYVIPQAALDEMALTNTHSFSETDPVFNKWVYGYHYDEKGRQIEKKIPGQDWEYFIYNETDNIIMSQNGNERAENGWMCFKYDALNRSVIAGYSLSYNGSRQSIQNIASSFNATHTNWERNSSGSTSMFYYSFDAFPQTLSEIFNVNYYDGYGYVPHLTIISPYAAPSTKSIHTNGLLTGNLTLYTTAATPLQSTYLLTKNFYDDKSNITESHKQHQLGGWDKYVNQYNFSRQLTNSVRTHTSSQHAALTITTQNVYDHAGRLVDVYKKVDSDPQVLMIHNEYNKIGQLITKKLHNDGTVRAGGNGPTNYLQTIDYRYNIRGWLTSINNSTITFDGGVKNTDADDAFGEEIFYNDVSGVSTGLNNLVPIGKFDGNISAVKWKFKSPFNGMMNTNVPVRSYIYRYDDLNRMTAGYYCQNSASQPTVFNSMTHYFDELLRYDVMGNIKSLDRTNKGQAIDDLSYNYTGNQVQSINDNISQAFITGFHDGNTGSNDYSYDQNGNLITDQNKKLSILYNHFNLPKTVTSTVNNTAIDYHYDGGSQKRKKTFNNSTRHYIDGIEYENGLQFILTEEGRIRPRSSTTQTPSHQFVYDYFMKDHLGNIRAVVTNEIQRRSYLATMEEPNAAAEELLFYNIPATREDKPIVYPYDPTYTPNWKISGLNASAGKPIGHAKVLEAMEGEMVDIDAKYFYSSSPFVPSNIRPIEDILSQMAAIFFLNPPSSIAESRLEVRQDWANETFLNNRDISDFLTNSFDLADQNNPNRDRPRAFLIYMFLNRDFRFNPDASGLLQVTDPDQLRDLAVLGLTLPSNGYLYVYVSNESAKDVNFDNLQIGHYTTHLTEVNDYYPYGLLMNNHSTGGITPQNYKYNGKELQKDLMFNVEDYGARFYDPVIGSWLQIDLLAKKYFDWNPYNYVLDNPIRNIDPDGNDVIVLNAPNNVGGLGHAAVLIGNDKSGWSLYSKNGTSPTRTSGPANKNPEVGVKFKDLKDFHDNYLNTDKNINAENGEPQYLNGFRISTSEEADIKMEIAAKKQTESWYDVTGTFGGSCIDVCTDALKAADLNPGTDNSKTGASRALLISKTVKSTVPNEVYKNITKNNVGVDISKDLIPSEGAQKKVMDAASQNKAE